MNKKTIIYIAIISLALFAGAGIASAAPAITSISGTLSNGSTVTIQGSGFGTKTTAVPLIWENFEWGDTGIGISQNGWINQNSTRYPTITTDKKYGGSKSAHTLLDTTYQFASAYKTITGSLELYGSYMIYWDYTVDRAGVFKLARFNSTTVYSGVPSLIIQFQPSGNIPETGWLYANQNAGGIGKHQTNLDNYKANKQAWHRVEMYLKLSDPPGATNGEVKISLDNVEQTLNWTNWTSGVTRDSGVTATLQYFLLPFMWANNTTGASTDVYADDVYVDTTQTRVELCDSSTWTTRTHCEIQIPSAWSDTSINVSTNQGSFTSLNSAYLYVIDANGNVNANGYLLSGGADTTPPSAPTGLAVM